MPRTGSGGRGGNLNADVRPYRDNAAAAGGDGGHGVRIADPRPASSDRLQTVRHSHSAICAMTSPDSNSAADQTSADTKLANWKGQYGISNIPAASGTE